jgi:hypothetical protein
MKNPYHEIHTFTWNIPHKYLHFENKVASGSFQLLKVKSIKSHHSRQRRLPASTSRPTPAPDQHSSHSTRWGIWELRTYLSTEHKRTNTRVALGGLEASAPEFLKPSRSCSGSLCLLG